MWLQPIFSPLSRTALRAFYRVDSGGGTVPATGPLLLVANHPNSLLDPAAVTAVAGRPVRFLAKAPLFSDPLVGWLVRGAGAIPVYRAQDGEAHFVSTDETFRAAHEALLGGSAIGIFPEGRSHSEPALMPLRTGAARIALGAATRLGQPFPIVPVGLVFRDKQRFRSLAVSVVGEPVDWTDLFARGDGDPEAVRELTARIDRALREVTVNLERREDAEVVLAAEEIFNAERGVRLPEAERVRALAEVSRGLARLRAGKRDDWLPLARDVRAHARRLRALGLAPHQLGKPGRRAALEWSLRQAAVLLPLLPFALAGAALYLLPYRLTDWLTHRFAPSPDTHATYKLLVGAVAYPLWTLLAGIVAGAAWGILAGATALLAAPLLGLAAVRCGERWVQARATVKRFLAREGREDELRTLARRQTELAARLAELRAAMGG